MRDTLQLGQWRVDATIDDDDHLTLYVIAADKSEVIECDAPDGFPEWVARLTTRKLEDDYENAQATSTTHPPTER